MKLYCIKLNKEAFSFLLDRFVDNHFCVFPVVNIQFFCVVLMFSKIILFILPSSDLHGFIKQHGVAGLKFCLSSFNVTNALFLCNTLKTIVQVAFSSWGAAFQYVFVILFLNSFLYFLGVSLYIFIVLSGSIKIFVEDLILLISSSSSFYF